MDWNDWLDGHGLSKYAELFAQHAIGLDVLAQLTDQELKELNIPLGDRKRLLRAAAELGGEPASGSPALAADKRSLPAGNANVLSSAEGERRKLTVLFCDLVGYTGLASRLDPEVLQGIVCRYEDACAACVTRYEGYVFQRVGEGIVAFFRSPCARGRGRTCHPRWAGDHRGAGQAGNAGRWQAYDLAALAYIWFTEGFDTKDLNEAQALLEELK